METQSNVTNRNSSNPVGIEELLMKEPKKSQAMKREGVAFLSQKEHPISIDVVEEEKI